MVDARLVSGAIAAYSSEFSKWTTYSKALLGVLRDLCVGMGVHPIVETRQKSLSSFAEKIIRKDKYEDPLKDMTDLCGARIITNTMDEVRGVCSLIRRHFEINERHSHDALQDLAPEQFGYRSFHFVVRLRPQTPGFSSKQRTEIGERQAEIQVRTLLQHAWAVVMHDMVYKARFQVPAAYKRDGAALAAGLEQVEGAFSSLIGNLGAYAGHHTAQMDATQRLRELDVLAMILDHEPDEAKRPAAALAISRVAATAGDFGRVVQVLNPFIKSKAILDPEIAIELANAHLRKGAAARTVLDLISRALTRLRATHADDPPPSGRPDPLLARAHEIAAAAHERAGERREARDALEDATRADPGDPYHFAALMAVDFRLLGSRRPSPTLFPSLRSAIETCRRHSSVGIELPRAWSTMARLSLMLGEPHQAFGWWCRALAFVRTAGDDAATDAAIGQLETDEREFLRATDDPQADRSEWLDWIEGLWDLVALARNPAAQGGLPAQGGLSKVPVRRVAGPVVIVAGGTDERYESDIREFGDLLADGLTDLAGTVISGGTRSGVCGLVGGLAKRLKKERRSTFRAIGYLPTGIHEAQHDDRYDEIRPVPSTTYSPAAPICAWRDILAAGIKPKDVLLVGINGGRISACEYQLALALGARVVLLERSGRAATDLAGDDQWADVSGLARLPTDGKTLRAAVHAGRPVTLGVGRRVSALAVLKPADLEPLGRRIHEAYRAQVKAKPKDPREVDWENLTETFKESNRQQAAYSARALIDEGFNLRPWSRGKSKVISLRTADVERLAEREHARWNAERIADGWRFADVRDGARKLSPYLVAWRELSDDVKQYDRNAVLQWPALFRDAGWEVVARAGRAGTVRP